MEPDTICSGAYGILERSYYGQMNGMHRAVLIAILSSGFCHSAFDSG